ncbi:MAG TPA: helix-turn-helix transcriptional regulator [Paludibacter sp.]|nr:helix-turn-helix transcriptional regulator [Paludibacter sp.]
MEHVTVKKNFVVQATQIVEKKVFLENYNLEMFASDLFMSKSNLNRKIKVSTGLTPVEFIRKVRFDYAFRLLKETDLSIKEVAYSSGFNDPKYFTRCFKKTYGISPKDYKNNLSKSVGYLWNNFNLN